MPFTVMEPFCIDFLIASVGRLNATATRNKIAYKIAVSSLYS